MRTIPAAIALACSLGTPALAATREEFGTAKEAEAMVAKAVNHIRSVGAQKAYQDFTGKAAPFVDRDLYVVVYDLEGRVLAHGLNPKMVGKELIDLRDADGKPFVRERAQLARTKSRFWHEYKFTDPVTRKVLPKATYCERLDATAVCVGIYKR